MDTFVNLTTGRYPVTLDEVRKDLNTISLPKDPSEKQLRRYGYSRVIVTEKPKGVEVVERYPRFVNGRFYQTWDVVESTDVGVWRSDLQKRLSEAYKRELNVGWDLSEGTIDITDSEGLSMVFLECLFLRDEDSKGTVEFYTRNHDIVEMGWKEGLDVVRQITKHKRHLKQHFNTELRSIKRCKTVGDCKVIKRKYDTEGVFKC